MDLLTPIQAKPMADKEGYNALHYALGVMDTELRVVNYSTRMQYVKSLLRKDFDFDLRTSNGKLCFQIAFEAFNKHHQRHIYDHFIDMVTLLIQGIDRSDILNGPVIWLSKSSTRLICWALSYGKDGLVNLLLSKGVDLSRCSREESVFQFPEGSIGLPAVYYTCFYASMLRTETFRQILEMSQNLNDYDGRGFYLPHIACSSYGTDVHIRRNF